MNPSQHILVCTEDAVLAKKIRFLLARDDCEVEILPAPNKLESRLLDGGISLLIVAANAGGEQTVDLLARLANSQTVPSTIVLGARSNGSPPSFVKMVEDPSDTQTIYKLAAESLESFESDIPIMEDAGLGEPNPNPRDFAERTQRTDFDQTQANEPVDMSDLSNLEFPSEDDVVASFDAHLEPETAPKAADEEDEEDITVFDVASYHAQSSDGTADKLGLNGELTPKNFAKVLYQCWTMEARGALVIAEDHETLTVHFENGSPIHVASDIRGDLLGRNLVERGVIDEDKYSQAAKYAIERGSSIGQATVDLGYFSKDALGRELGEDAFERIVKRFGSTRGSFEFHADRPAPSKERPYRIPIGRILAEGLRRHCPDESLEAIVGDVDKTYFRLRSSVEELAKRFPFNDSDFDFMAFSGRAYNVADATRLSEQSRRESHVLMALLITCEEVDPFTPGVGEFEARIQEEQLRQEELEARVSQIPDPSPAAPAAAPPVVSAPPVSAPPVSAPPVSAPPVSAPPVSAPPASAASVSSPPVSAPSPAFARAAPEPATPFDEPEAPPSAPPPGTSAPFAALTAEASDVTREAPPAEDFASPTGDVNPIPPPPIRQAKSAEYYQEGGKVPETEAPTRPKSAPSRLPPPPVQAATPQVEAPPPQAAPPAPPAPTGVPAPANSIPPMPEPPPGSPGRIPRPVVFAPPLPRSPDGSVQQTPEHSKSKEHFQKGVGLLGQGKFDEAEEAFRDAIALCADEHVYLIGLSRALYYNPSYTARGKVPVLRTIVDRATTLAPADNRVKTLVDWVSHAEQSQGG